MRVPAAKPRSALERRRVQVHFSEPSLTHQSFKDECDANHIVDQYARTGIIPNPPRVQARYIDNPETDLFTAACVAAEARSLDEEGVEYPDEEIVDSEGFQDDLEPLPGETDLEESDNPAPAESNEGADTVL